MSLVIHDAYGFNLATSGKLKLRAKGLLAGGRPDEVFEACVLLHEAARIQQRAVSALPSCPAATRLASALEECWCFVEGFDPPLAAVAWGRVLSEQEVVDRPTAEAMRSRLEPKYEASKRAYGLALKSSPNALRMLQTRSIVGGTTAERARLQREVDAFLRRFPGAIPWQWFAYRLAEASGDKGRAWDALTRARRLDPDNRTFKAMSLLLAARTFPPDSAEEHLAHVRSSLEREGEEVCIMYALAELALARKGPQDTRASRWRRALDAAHAGLSQVSAPHWHAHLKAIQMMAEELLSGREPTLEILYRAGLSEVAAAAKPKANVVDLLVDHVRQFEPARVAA
jgi:tetratricopeptide (TPR) repeat protein